MRPNWGSRSQSHPRESGTVADANQGWLDNKLALITERSPEEPDPVQAQAFWGFDVAVQQLYGNCGII